MRPTCHLSVQGGSTHVVAKPLFTALQTIVADLGADTYPLFLRLGGAPLTRMQPVTARALLREVERFAKELRWRLVPGVQFRDAAGTELGAMFTPPGGHALFEGDRSALFATPEGLRVVLNLFPPPAGFRSRPGMKPLHYECFFREVLYKGSECLGLRTEEMGGGDTPIPLPAIAPPPVTRWDFARVAGKPDVASMLYVEVPAPDVYRDQIHALVSACEDSLRLKTPLVFRPD